MSGFGFASSNPSSSLFGGNTGASSTTSGFGSNNVFGQSNNSLINNSNNQAQAKDTEVVSPPEDTVSSLAFSPATLPQNYLIAGSWDNKISCWEIQMMGSNFQSVPKAQQSHSGPVLDVAWSDVRFGLFCF
jgi:mRNA export factor